jgi:diguanylate cyclase (GGDEF)-like protein
MREKRRIIRMRSSRTSAPSSALQQRLIELEAENSTAVARARLIAAASTAIADLAKTLDAAAVVAKLLASVSALLGLRRVIYFDPSEEGRISKCMLDEAPRLHGTPPGILLLLSQRDLLPSCDVIRIGRADDVSAPIADVRGWYLLAPVRSEHRLFALLYGDDHRSKRIDPVAAELFSLLASVAAAALRAAEGYASAHRLARSDPLTGLLNRRAAEECIDELLRCGRKTDGITCAIAIIDVDDLKQINDLTGHSAGDAAIAMIAGVLASASRDRDLVARLAGDEFVVAFAECDADMARALVRRLSRELRAKGLRCSIGAALSTKSDDRATILARADAALYAVKNAGKNGFAFG